MRGVSPHSVLEMAHNQNTAQGAARTVVIDLVVAVIIFTLGAACLVSLGLLIAARVTSEELAGGLLNLLSWPMMFLSGVWFSLEGAPRALRLFADAMPLTHVIDAARAVMTEGATLRQVSGHLAVLAAMTAVFLLIGAWSFRWE